MSAPIERFTLADAEGVEHAYTVSRHPASQGLEIVFVLLGYGAGALAPFVRTLLDGGVSLSSLMGGKEDSGIDEVLRGVDFGAVAGEVKALLGGPDGRPLVSKLLTYTHRDGQRLADSAAFDLAYTGNYLELLTACWKIIGINRFFPLPGTSLSAKSG